MERVDVRKEAEKLIQKHSFHLQKLKESALSQEAFRESAMKATESFKANLKNFLKENEAEDLYEELVGFVSGKVSEIVSFSKDSHQ